MFCFSHSSLAVMMTTNFPLKYSLLSLNAKIFKWYKYLIRSIFLILLAVYPISLQILQAQVKTQAQVNLKKPSSMLVAGPMVGSSFHHEVLIWLQAQVGSKIHLRYWQDGENWQVFESESYEAQAQNYGIVHVHLSGLKENQSYRYQVWINGELIHTDMALKFQTQKIWFRYGQPNDFSMLIGSCAFINELPEDTYGGQTEIFDQMAKSDVDLMLWLGDYIYLRPEDWMSMKGMMNRYLKTRTHPALKQLTSRFHHFAIWDDHDFGPNDANRSFSLKKEALEAFKLNWANPSYGLPELPGIFGHFSWSDVDFFLLDNRSYRATSLKQTPDAPYLGDQQVNWLLDALANSRAPFKIIASGSQVLNPYQRFENASLHPTEINALIDGIKLRKIEGVLFLSGDRHHTELIVKADDPHFYPLYDFTSSPLTSGPSASSAKEEQHNPYRVDGTFVTGKRNYGKISVSGAYGHRKMKLETFGVDGALIWEKEILAQDLKIPAEFGKKK